MLTIRPTCFTSIRKFIGISWYKRVIASHQNGALKSTTSKYQTLESPPKLDTSKKPETVLKKLERKGITVYRRTVRWTKIFLWFWFWAFGFTLLLICLATIFFDMFDPDGINYILSNLLNEVILDKRIVGIFGPDFEIQGERVYGYSGGFITVPSKYRYDINNTECLRLGLNIRSSQAKGHLHVYLRREEGHWKCFYIRLDVLPPNPTPPIILIDRRRIFLNSENIGDTEIYY